MRIITDSYSSFTESRIVTFLLYFATIRHASACECGKREVQKVETVDVKGVPSVRCQSKARPDRKRQNTRGATGKPLPAMIVGLLHPIRCCASARA
jgi:hypothetical protein